MDEPKPALADGFTAEAKGCVIFVHDRTMDCWVLIANGYMLAAIHIAIREVRGLALWITVVRAKQNADRVMKSFAGSWKALIQWCVHVCMEK
eukprot:scaffold89004_cov21-Tisochrysis_lutea.AAC.2